MSKYVEDGYVQGGYVDCNEEAETNPPASQNCDLSLVMSEISSLKEKLDSLISSVSSHRLLTLEINSKLVSLSSNFQDVDLSNLVTKDFLISSIPFANDKHLDVYPKGTIVKIRYLPAIYTVYSSRFVPTPNNYHSFSLIYTVHKVIGGKDYYSDYHSSDVIDINPDDWVYQPPQIEG